MGLLDRMRPRRSSIAETEPATGVVLFTAGRPPLLEPDHLDAPQPAPAPPAAPPPTEPRSIIDHQPAAGDTSEGHQPVGGEPSDAADLLSAIASSGPAGASPAAPRPLTTGSHRSVARPPAPTRLPPREPPQVEWSKAEHDEPEVYAFTPEPPADEPDGLLDHFADLLDGTGEPNDDNAA